MLSARVLRNNNGLTTLTFYISIERTSSRSKRGEGRRVRQKGLVINSRNTQYLRMQSETRDHKWKPHRLPRLPTYYLLDGIQRTGLRRLRQTTYLRRAYSLSL